MTSLLPHNSTPTERAIETATDRLIPVPIADLWSPENCPAALLPWLAWTLSVDNWDAGWSEETKRAVISASVDVHRHKGTVWAMRRALTAAGLGDANIQEGWSANQYNGTFAHDGSRLRQQADHWAEYRVVLSRPLSIAQADLARSILTASAPARCHLKHMSFEEAALLYNRTANHDGTFTRGVI